VRGCGRSVEVIGPNAGNICAKRAKSMLVG
jgi:hypothetical protein